jgi:hypothetical protein
MANLSRLTTPNEVRLASSAQLGEHGFGMPFRLLDPREKNSLKSSMQRGCKHELSPASVTARTLLGFSLSFSICRWSSVDEFVHESVVLNMLGQHSSQKARRERLKMFLLAE